ncbi:hypothetical protein FHT44_006144 [Mycolicibacterium sp. BK634]|uniref:hypothetical protein n=1 Tax=Mycolicibacterium sp. BK634 TaxID=2587099 RepID=UPI00161BCE56|nr:hypothetical protein [Mycolicibacterium sp. BK634]MBB3753622.1 hypothetical protein [Mycolicibacterium sp. BK634]
MSSPKSNKSQALLTLRSAVVLLCALIIGIVAGVLTYLSTRGVAGALLAAGTAFGGAVLWFNKIIAT